MHLDNVNNMLLDKYYSEAYDELKLAVKDKEEGAYAKMGLFLLKGIGVEPNQEEGLKYFNLALEENDPFAMSTLADFYFDGKYLEQDINKALELYNKAYKLNEVHSIGMLGLYYFNNQEYDIALKYFKEGSIKKDINSTYYLGVCAYEGYGMEKDYKLAYLSFLACYNYMPNNKMFAESYANLALKGYGMDQDYALAYKIYENVDSDIANYNRAVMLKDGLGVEQDYAKSYELFKRVKSKESLFEQAFMEYNGLGVEENKNNAFFKFFACANSKYEISYPFLGDCYLYGYGTKKSFDDALVWYNKALEYDIPNKYFNLGYAYFSKKKYDEALKYFLKEEESANIYLSIAECYLKLKDYKNAISYFEKADKLDNWKGAYNLYMIYKKGKGVKKDKTLAGINYIRYVFLQKQADNEENKE